MKILILLIILTATTYGQNFYKKCPDLPQTFGYMEVTGDGDINLVPCPTKQVLINGQPLPTPQITPTPTPTPTPGNGSGDVIGPTSSTDNALALFDGTTGKVLKNSFLTSDNNGSLLFQSGQGIRGPPSSGNRSSILFSGNNILFNVANPGNDVVVLDNYPTGHKAKQWYINNGNYSGSQSNRWELITNVSTTDAPIGLVFYDYNNPTYPMGIGYKWDGTSPSHAWNNKVGFVDDTMNFVMSVNDFGHIKGTQMELSGQLTVKKVPNVGQPTVSVQGTSGSSSYSYVVVAVMEDGSETEASVAATITNGNASLSTSNFNRISWNGQFYAPDFMPPTRYWKIYRTAGGETQGLIYTLTGFAFPLQIDDTGLAAGGETPSTVNTTGNLTLAGNITVSNSFTPASSSAPCRTGTMAWDADFIYVCVAQDQWSRSALSSW